jgi:hypothetical protein
MSGMTTGHRCRRFTVRDAAKARRGVRVPARVTDAELARGMNVEREHADVTRCSPLLSAKIAAAHLRERLDYYQRLKKVEG